MKCPFKMGRYDFEGGEECNRECAWLVTAPVGSSWDDVCAIVLVGSDSPRGAVNSLKRKEE